jgi:hypothetical protein
MAAPQIYKEPAGTRGGRRTAEALTTCGEGRRHLPLRRQRERRSSSERHGVVAMGSGAVGLDKGPGRQPGTSGSHRKREQCLREYRIGVPKLQCPAARSESSETQQIEGSCAVCRRSDTSVWLPGERLRPAGARPQTDHAVETTRDQTLAFFDPHRYLPPHTPVPADFLTLRAAVLERPIDNGR